MGFLRVEKAVYGGALTTDGQQQLSFVLAGELVEAAPLRILEASPDRVAARCVHFGECGGCQYQHADYPAQLKLKLEILKGILAGAGLGELPEISVHSGEEWGYRNRIRLRVEAGELGYSRRGTNEFLPIRMCPIAAPLLWNMAQSLVNVVKGQQEFGRWMGAVSEVELFCDGGQTRLQILFLLRDAAIARREPAIFERLCDALREAVAELTGVGASLDPELNRRARRNAGWDGASWGADGLAYQADGRSYWVGRGAFFQVNRFLVDRLVELVCLGQSGKLAWDLFAGVGLFTRALAERFGNVVAVEAGDVAAAGLAIAGKRDGYEAVHGSTLDFLRGREHQRERPELVVLDPPRAGLGAEAAEILARIGAAEVVYVSCDPTTLALDLAILTRERYEIVGVDLIDLFPQTFHLETLVRMRKTG